MMVLANGKKDDLLEQERTYLNTLTYRLFVNSHSPADADTAGDYTECSDSGYAAVTGVGFDPAFLNGSNQAEVRADPVTWVFDHNAGDFTVYGYYVTDPADNALVFAEAALTPFTVTAEGASYTVVPRKIQTTYAGG